MYTICCFDHVTFGAGFPQGTDEDVHGGGRRGLCLHGDMYEAEEVSSHGH